MNYLRRKLMAMMSAKKSRLPAEYQEVEYIESTGTQYINTGIVPKIGYSSKGKVRLIEAGSNGFWVCAVRDTTGNTRFNFLHFSANNSAAYGFGADGPTGITVNFNVDYEYETILANGFQKFKFGNEEYTNNVTWDYTFSRPLYLFRLQNHGALYGNGYGRIYWLEIYDENNMLIANYIPCYRKSDSVAGMYDLVENQFYTGTGGFIKGGDV